MTTLISMVIITLLLLRMLRSFIPFGRGRDNMLKLLGGADTVVIIVSWSVASPTFLKTFVVLTQDFLVLEMGWDESCREYTALRILRTTVSRLLP